MKFKGLKDDSRIKEIGSVFRRHEGSDWNINVKLTPHQQKQYFGFSQVPILARRRVLNATKALPQAGFTRSVTIASTRSWEVEQIKACPIPVVNRQGDSKQWCFVFDFNGTRYFLPQIELARVLFLHTAYLARLSLIQNGLSQEFDIQRTSLLNRVRINILPTSSLPLQTRRDDARRQQLTWILLDKDARHSFDSIATHQLNNGYDSDKYRLWDFQFDPPALAGAELALRGHYESELNAFFVYEIDGISKLPSSCPAHVDIVDPRYAIGQPGQGRSGQARSNTGAEPTIDDEEDPNTDLAEVQIDAPSFKFELARPLSTTRISAGKSRAGSHETEEEQTDQPENNCLEVSTGESSIHGVLPPADYSAANEKNDNTDIYTDKFKAFDAMVQQLVNTSDCVHTHHEIRKLPAIYGYSKNLRRDGSPRYLVWHVIKKGNHLYSLVEVDTTDNPSSLSTLLIKHKNVSLNSQKYIGELEIQLIIERQLSWPAKVIVA